MRSDRPVPIADQRLLLIGPEAHCRSLARTLRLLCPVETRALGSAAARSRDRPAVVVTSGIALRDGDAIRAMQTALRPFLSNAVPVLCLLEAPSPYDEVQARAMGASMVLPADLPARTIADGVRDLLRLPGTGQRAQKEEAYRRVQDVGLILDELMGAAARGGRVESGTAANAAGLLSRALAHDGIGYWMRTVAFIHDPTYRHCLLMAGITAAFVLRLGFNAADSDRLTRAAILHDIGKALVPVEIINKTGSLTRDEMDSIQSHASGGHELLVAQGGHDATTLEVVRHHHEYLDGTGYPDGLRGDQISDAVRIATICDVFAALIETRSYKPSLPATQAFTLMEQMGPKLDPALLNAFRQVFVPMPA